MNIIKIWNDSPSEKQIDEICKLLDDGKVIIIPTDTIYAIVCDALNVKAINKICKLKGINPEKSNLSILCSDIAMAAEYARIDNQQYRLLKTNTPGPFTFLFRALHSLPKAFKDRKIVGIRIPDNQTDLKIINHIERPLLTTTIDFTDSDYAINPELIAETYDGRVDALVDGGEGETTPSSIVDCTGESPEIIREGPREIIGI